MKSLSPQFSFHKAVEITVQDSVNVSRFVISSVIFHKLVWRLHVTANLRTPRVIAAVAAQRVHLRLTLGAGALGQLRFENLHGTRAVLVLAAFVLTTDHDVGGQVRDANRRVGLVDVLTTGAR